MTAPLPAAPENRVSVTLEANGTTATGEIDWCGSSKAKKAELAKIGGMLDDLAEQAFGD